MTPFDSLALKYDLWYEKPFGRSAFELEVKCLKELAGEFGSALEVGVGTGRFAEALGVEFGLDPSYEMLKLARDRGIKCVQGAGENLPFRNEVFDLVLIVVSICFVDNPAEVLEECRRVLKRGGTLLLGLIVRESRWADFYIKKAREGHPIYRHATFYSLRDIEVLLESKGFRIERMLSTLLEEPQDEEPVSKGDILEGFEPLAGFTCIKATLELR